MYDIYKSDKIIMTDENNVIINFKKKKLKFQKQNLMMMN